MFTEKDQFSQHGYWLRVEGEAANKDVVEYELYFDGNIKWQTIINCNTEPIKNEHLSNGDKRKMLCRKHEGCRIWSVE